MTSGVSPPQWGQRMTVSIGTIPPWPPALASPPALVTRHSDASAEVYPPPIRSRGVASQPGEPQLFLEVFTLTPIKTRLTLEFSHFEHFGLAASCAEMDSMTLNS